MSTFSYDKIPFGVKASNIAAVANFSSTLDDSYIFVIANNCNTPVYNNQNSYDTVYNSFKNAALFGAINNQMEHEAYIAIKSSDTIKKIAQFNTINTTINANIIPFTNGVYNIGTSTTKWKDVYATNLYGDGSHLTNVNISDRTTNNLPEGANNLYYTDQRFDNRLATKTLDVLNDGTKNRFIIDNNYKGNFNVEGTLSACNLVIEGDTTVLNTTLYQTEKMEINNDAPGPAMKISQNTVPGDALQVYDNNNISLSVIAGGNVGIKTATPQYDLDINGTARAQSFIGGGLQITNINLADKSTRYLQEDPDGSNLYFTHERAGVIAEASNIHTSNYVKSVDNAFGIKFDTRLLTKTLDNILNGTSNKLITNNTYAGDLNVTQKLTTYDLNVTNSFVFNKVVEQTVSQASRTVIENTSIGPALKVIQRGSYDVLQAYVENDIALSIIHNRFVGINKLTPAYNLDVNGTAQATNFRGDGSMITNINLSDKSTRYLAEDPGGSNLYFTHLRAAAVVDTSNIDTCNFVKSTSNQIISHLQITDKNVSNYACLYADETVKNASNSLLTQISSLNTLIDNITTNDVAEGINNLYYTDERFDIRLFSKTLDTVHQGTSNRFIINNNFKGNLNIEGTLSACNLVIEGDATVLNTTLYATERFEIVNQSSEPAFKIEQISSTGEDILQVYHNAAPVFNINSRGLIGINKAVPEYTLDVAGIISASKIITDGVNISNINLTDKSTRYLAEDPGGSNLYFTPERAGIIANASNIHTSNYILVLANSLIYQDTNQSNYIITTSNTLENSLLYQDTNQSNYILASSNNLANSLIYQDTNQSNYIITSSNNLVNTLTRLDTNQSNYIFISSNILVNTLTQLDINQSNYIFISSNILVNTLAQLDTNQSNYVFISSNILVNTLTQLDTNQSNYIITSSNILVNTLTQLDINQSNYVLTASNTLVNTLIHLDTAQSNYVLSSSNAIINIMKHLDTIQSNYIRASSNELANMTVLLGRNNSNYVRTTSNNLANYVKQTCNVISAQLNKSYADSIAYTQTTADTLNNNLSRGLNSLSSFVNVTSNLLASHTNTLNSFMSNYVRDSSNELVKTINLKDTLTSNYISSTSNLITRHILTNEVNTSNYFLSTSILSAKNFSDVSNYVLSTESSTRTHILTNETNTCNYIADAANSLHTRITNLDTNQIREANNLYYTDERFDIRLLTKTLDTIHQGSSNQFIANNNFKGDLNIQGTLSACNLVIEGDTTVLNTTTYQTESLEIINAGTGTTLKLRQTGFYNILEAYDDTNILFKITDTGKVGILVSEPQYELDVLGTIQATRFIGAGTGLTDISIVDKTTRHLREDDNGSNLYFTPARVGVIASASNVHTSNYIANQSNLLAQQIISNEVRTCNYIDLISNIIVQQFTKTAPDSSNYVNTTSNYILLQMISNDKNASNYIATNSNIISSHILQSLVDTSNFVRATCNFIFDTISSDLYKTSNNIQDYISYTSNNIQNYITLTSNTIQNNIAHTSNVIVKQLLSSDTNVSNFVSSTSNNLVTRISFLDSNQSNYVSMTSNNIINYVRQLNSNQSNYTLSTSNILANIIYNIDVRQSNYLQTTNTNLNRDLLNNLAFSNLNLSNYVATTGSNLANTDLRHSNYTLNVSNILVSRLVNLEAAQSNYIINTSNRLASAAFTYNINQSNNASSVYIQLRDFIVLRDTNQSNYVLSTSNRIDRTINTTDRNQSNYVSSTNNFLVNLISTNNRNQSNYVLSTSTQIYAKIKLLDDFDAYLFGRTDYLTRTLSTLNTTVFNNNINQSNYTSSVNETLSTRISSTSNKITDYIVNYIAVELKNTSNQISNRLTQTSNTITDYIVNYVAVELKNTSNQISNRLTDTSNTITDYMVNYVAVELKNTSNQISNRLTDTSNTITDYMFNYVAVELKNTSNQLSNRLTDTSNTITDYMVNYIGVKLIQTSNELINRLNITTTDDIPQGTRNKYIVNNTYNNDLYIEGSLRTSNLIVDGTTTTLNTITYQTERLEIISNALGPALKVQQYGDQDILALYDDDKVVFQVLNGGHVNIAGSINNISSNDFENIRGTTAPLQTQITKLANEILDISDTLYNTITESLDTTNENISNALYSVFINGSNDVIQARAYTQATSNNLIEYIAYTSNKLYANVNLDTFSISNYIDSVSDRITNLTSDDVAEGDKNRYIVNDKYERDILFTETASATTLVTKSLIDFGGIDIYNDTYYTPSLMIKHDNEADVLNISVANVPKLVMRNNGFVGFNTDFPEFDVDVAGVLHATRFSGDGGLLENVNLSDKNTDDIIEGSYNLYFREERLDEMIMSKSIDMFQPGSNMSIIRNGVYYGSLLVAGQLTVNSLRILDVNASYISSNASNFGDGVFGEDSEFYTGNKASLALISNLDYDIRYVSNMLLDTIYDLNNITITSLDQVGNGTSNKFIVNNWYDGPLNVNGRMQAAYVGGDGMFLTNVNLLDKTTDHLAEGYNKWYYTHDRFVHSMQNINADYLNNGSCNQFIINGVYEGDLIVTGELTVSRVQILDIFTNVLNSNYEASYYQSSNSYVQSLASFIRNINANLVNEMKNYDKKLNLIMTCNMDETILGMLANDSNLLLRRFGETIDYVNQNVSNLNNEIYESMSNLIEYVNVNVSRVNYYYHYAIDESNMSFLTNLVNSSNNVLARSINERINSLNTNDIKEGNNLYFTHKRAGAICYASNLHVSNYVDYHIHELNRKLDDSNITSINSIKYNVDILENMIEYCNIDASNYINWSAERLENRINYLTLDEISMGCNNSYIRNNVYDGYLIVTGGIITNNVVISDLDEAYLMLSSNVKDLLTSTPFKSSSNSYLQYLINKVNVHSDIIEDNYVNIIKLTSNFDLTIELLKNIDTTSLSVNSNAFNSLASNIHIIEDNINKLTAYSITSNARLDNHESNIFHNSNEIEKLKYELSLANNRIGILENTNTMQTYQINTLNNNMQNVISRLALIESLSIVSRQIDETNTQIITENITETINTVETIANSLTSLIEIPSIPNAGIVLIDNPTNDLGILQTNVETILEKVITYEREVYSIFVFPAIEINIPDINIPVNYYTADEEQNSRLNSITSNAQIIQNKINTMKAYFDALFVFSSTI